MKTILVIGDVMLDKFSYGRVKRLNPESPAPLILIERTEHKLGGASNVAANIVSLGGQATLVGKIGMDSNGQILKSLCEEGGLPFEAVFSDTEPTITKERVIETTYHQQLVRIDYESIGSEDADSVERIRSIIDSLSPELIVVSDYQKGLITESLAKVIMSSGVPVLGDLKPGNLSWFQGALAIKPNFKEFREEIRNMKNSFIKSQNSESPEKGGNVHENCESERGVVGTTMSGKRKVGMKISHFAEIPEENTDAYIETYGPALARSLDTNLVITRSEHGVSVVLKNSEVHHMPTLAQDVFDVTGAGDTFIAAMAVAFSEGKTLVEAAVFGNKASAVAVGKVGTVTVNRNEVSI